MLPSTYCNFKYFVLYVLYAFLYFYSTLHKDLLVILLRFFGNTEATRKNDRANRPKSFENDYESIDWVLWEIVFRNFHSGKVYSVLLIPSTLVSFSNLDRYTDVSRETATKTALRICLIKANREIEAYENIFRMLYHLR